MFDQLGGRLTDLAHDKDEEKIGLLLNTLRGDAQFLEPCVEANLLACATTALFYGRRMGFESDDAHNALAAICLVIGQRRIEFFENIFLKRMMGNPNLTPSEKLNRIVEIVIGTIPRPQPHDADDVQRLEYA